MQIRKAFGQTLKRLRTKHGFSQDALGNKTGLGQNYISELERSTKTPSLTTIVRLAEAFEMTTTEFVSKFEKRFKAKS